MTPERRKNRAHAFQDCLDQVHAGGSLEAALDKHSQYSKSMRSDLEAACWLDGHRQEMEPRPGFVTASRPRLLERIEQGGPVTQATRLRWAFLSLRYPSTWRHYAPRMALAYLLLVAMLLTAGRVSRASLNWMPGDIGYPVKTALEDAAVLASPTAAGDARLHIQLAHRRMLEAQALVLEGDFEHLPATVADFSRHVDGAVRSVHRVAQKDRGQAYHLALDLERVLSQQTPMVVLLSGFTPENARPDFQRVLIISESGISGVKQVLEQEDSGANLDGGASLDGAGGVLGQAPTWELAYSIVRGRLAG
jgi:hypothetical protein